ncbi:hypothetical protein CARUB_v10025280mg [Capsella rubella]|uniref:DC1 domain-containing protein n=1 Tax=Capsella rubella TaxID=81985 RepID=R0G1D7_9BRAS|nr:uncharacterized protein LOC17889357 [Capsella rubella]EOA29026.1 hypothetical protein CARUB_v10025280mg [Capsella rubella]
MGKPTSQNNNFINHFSHPHRLQLAPATSSPPCSACKLAGGNGRVYSCRPCNFFLHESCSKMKQVITHPSHPSHTLTLLVAPVYDGGYFNCDGCGVHGTGFSYQCSLCDFDIHALCAYKPLSIIHQSHPQHSLKLTFHSPYGANKGFSCDICLKIGKNQWLYRCIPCEFDAHVACIAATNSHLLQHSASSPNPHAHHAGHPHHQNSLPVPNQGSNRPRPMPMTRPNRPLAQHVSPNGPRRQNNNLVYNAQVGPFGQNELIGQVEQSFGQGSTDGSGYDGSVVGDEEFNVEVDVNVEVEYEGDEYVEEANDEGEDIDGNGLEVVAYGDDVSVARSESDFGGSSDARSQCNDMSDADLYPLSLDNSQGPRPRPRPLRMNQGPGGGKKKNTNLNGPAARSKNMVLNGPRGGLQGSKSPIQSPRAPQAGSVQNVRYNAIRGRGGAVSVRVNRPRDPSAFGAPQGFNGPSVGPSNAIDGSGNNDNYNEGDGTDVYVGEDNVGYNESYGDHDYADGDGDCDFEVGGDFADDGCDQDYDDTYGENDFENYSDITGGSGSMYDEGESYGTKDDSQYNGLNEDPNNQYLPMVGGPGVNNQNQYGQNGRPGNIGTYGRGGTSNMNRYGNVNQGGNRIQPRAMGRPVQYRANGRPNRANGGPYGPNGGPINGPMLMNTMVQGLCQGIAMNMLIGDGNGGASDGGGSSILGGLLGGETE